MEHRQWLYILIIFAVLIILSTVILCYLEILKRRDPDAEGEDIDQRILSERASAVRTMAAALGAAAGIIIFSEYFPKVPKIAALVISLLLDIIIIGGLIGVFPRKLSMKKKQHSASVYNFAQKLFHATAVLWAPEYIIGTIISTFFGAGKDKDEEITEEKILQLVDEGNETGSINESQKEMINNIFDLDETLVSDVMTHRKDMVAVDEKSSVNEVASVAIREGYSRIPLYKGDIDKITGVIYVKDLLPVMKNNEDKEIEAVKFERDVMFVPETAKCSEVMKTMLKNRTQIAIVSDEYGGTFGIVSMEDLVEEIIGNIQDEYDNEETEIQKINNDTYVIDGDARPEEVFEKLGIEFEEEDKYDTMSGLVVDLLGDIPKEGSEKSAIYKGNEMTVIEMKDNWISKIRLKLRLSGGFLEKKPGKEL